MSFENAQRLSNQELSVLQDQKQLTALKTQIESDNNLKNRFLDHYMTYIDRSNNEQSKKYVTHLFIKAINFLALIGDKEVINQDNLKEVITSIQNPKSETIVSDKDTEKDDDVNPELSDSQETTLTSELKSAAALSTEVPIISNHIEGEQKKIITPKLNDFSGLFGSVIDVNKLIDLHSTINFNDMLKNAYEVIKTIKSLSKEIQKKDISERIKEIDALQAYSIKGIMTGEGRNMFNSMIDILPATMASDIKTNYSGIMSGLTSNPERFAEFKQAMITGITLCKNGFVSTVCDELFLNSSPKRNFLLKI